MRAGNADGMQDEADSSNLADGLEIPSSLEGVGKFVRLSEIAEVAKGPTGIKGARPGPYPLVVTAEERGSCDHYDFDGEAVLIPTVSSTGHGDASLKRIHYQEGRFAVGSILAAVRVHDRALHSTRFLYEYLSVFKDELLVARMSGTANVSLTIKKIEGVPIPLIPIAQQRHLHDLMLLCDALEAKGRLKAEQHARLFGTLMGALTDSSTPEDLAANWQRVADHFDLLLDRPEAVDALEQTILQLAVRGLLVPQDPSDDPATVLLAQIRTEKDRLIADGKIKRDKVLPEVDEEVAPFALPAGWAWARFPELGVFGRGKSKHRPRNDPALFNPPIYPLVQTGEVARAKGTILEYHSKYSELGLAQSRLWPAGTLCITIAANIADAAVLGFDACFPDSVVGFVPASCLGGTAYFQAFLETAKTDLVKFAPATAQKNINLEILESLLVPLPPKREIERIVARVNELRRLCADLRQRLSRSSATQAALAEALIESAQAA